jgi:hypothetical protein
MARRRLLLVSLCTALAAGCALGTQRFGRAIDTGRIASIEVGVSSKADVLRLFGPPTAYSRLPVVAGPVEAGFEAEPPDEPDPDVFVYEYREDRESFFTAILYTRFRRQVLADRLMVFFDAKDVVRYVAFAQETDVGGDAE